MRGDGFITCATIKSVIPECQHNINETFTNRVRFNQRLHLDHINLVKAERSHANFEYVFTKNIINI